MTDGSTRRPVVRDRYRPAEFESERYSADNLAFWTPIIVHLGRVHDGNEVLDLGCATGGFSAAIVDATGAHVVGCDLSIMLMEYGRGVRGRALQPYVCADATNLPFASARFDRVISSLVLHQIRDRQRVFIEVGRILRSGGRLLVRTVTPDAAMRWIPHRFFPSIAQAQADRMPSITELSNRIAQAGFSDIGSQTVVREKRLDPEQVERSLRRDVADRYPFVDDDELRGGVQRMRAHWATGPDALIDERRFSFLIAVKPG